MYPHYPNWLYTFFLPFTSIVQCAQRLFHASNFFQTDWIEQDWTAPNRTESIRFKNFYQKTKLWLAWVSIWCGWILFGSNRLVCFGLIWGGSVSKKFDPWKSRRAYCRTLIRCYRIEERIKTKADSVLLKCKHYFCILSCFFTCIQEWAPTQRSWKRKIRKSSIHKLTIFGAIGRFER